MLGFLNSVSVIGTNWFSIKGAFYDAQSSGFRIVDIIMLFIPGLFSVISGIVIWRKAEFIAGKIFPPGATPLEGTATNLSREEILKLAIKIIGIWMIVKSIPGLISLGASLFFPSNSVFNNSAGNYYDQQRIIGLIRVSVEFLVGWLLLASSQVLNFLKAVFLFERELIPQIPVQEISNMIRCPYCKDPINGAVRVQCEKCGTFYHETCLREHGGCSILGCA